MPIETTIFECYGHGAPGSAIVLAGNRAQAIQICEVWLHWTIAVAFSATDKYTLWTNCGGTLQKPVVYAADNEHYNVLVAPLPQEQARGQAAETWESIYEQQ